MFLWRLYGVLQVKFLRRALFSEIPAHFFLKSDIKLFHQNFSIFSVAHSILVKSCYLASYGPVLVARSVPANPPPFFLVLGGCSPILCPLFNLVSWFLPVLLSLSSCFSEPQAEALLATSAVHPWADVNHHAPPSPRVARHVARS